MLRLPSALEILAGDVNGMSRHGPSIFIFCQLYASSSPQCRHVTYVCRRISLSTRDLLDKVMGKVVLVWKHPKKNAYKHRNIGPHIQWLSVTEPPLEA